LSQIKSFDSQRRGPLELGTTLGPYEVAANAKWPYDIWMLEGFEKGRPTRYRR